MVPIGAVAGGTSLRVIAVVRKSNLGAGGTATPRTVLPSLVIPGAQEVSVPEIHALVWFLSAVIGLARNTLALADAIAARRRRR